MQRVYDWNWACNCRGAPLTSPPVTLADLATTPGEPLLVPNSGYSIGSGYEVLVLYAAEDRITLKYTRNDNVVHGYTLHLERLCVWTRPCSTCIKAGMRPAAASCRPCAAGQALGRAADATVGVAIRDSGTVLDPRSRKDWWRGR